MTMMEYDENYVISDDLNFECKHIGAVLARVGSMLSETEKELNAHKSNMAFIRSEYRKKYRGSVHPKTGKVYTEEDINDIRRTDKEWQDKVALENDLTFKRDKLRYLFEAIKVRAKALDNLVHIEIVMINKDQIINIGK